MKLWKIFLHNVRSHIDQKLEQWILLPFLKTVCVHNEYFPSNKDI
jgi:hypothetical protein